MEHQSLPALALVLAAAVACGLFMSRMRMPAAAGFILVGVALGPSGAALVTTSGDIELLAELGVLMLLFITIRIMKGHFTPEHHFGFEGAAWYWHFVDVVWLGLYIVVYWL